MVVAVTCRWSGVDSVTSPELAGRDRRGVEEPAAELGPDLALCTPLRCTNGGMNHRTKQQGDRSFVRAWAKNGDVQLYRETWTAMTMMMRMMLKMTMTILSG